MLGHFNVFGLKLPGSYLGVEVFFVLSGYLITGLLINEFNLKKQISIKSFFMRRALRLFPALAFMVAMVVGSQFFLMENTPASFFKASIPALFYFANWIRAGWSFGFAGLGGYFEHTWSLSIEEQYYLIWPLLCFVVLKKTSVKGLVISSLITFFCLEKLKFNLSHKSIGTWEFFYFSTLRADSIILGSFGAAGVSLIANKNRLNAFFDSSLGKIISYLSFFFLFLANIFPFSQVELATYLWKLPVFDLVSVVLLLSLNFGSGKLVSFFSAEMLTWIGKRAYGIYLWHWPVAWYFQNHLLELKQTPFMYIIYGIAISIIFAAVSFKFVEKPFLEMKRNLIKSS